jgi:mannose-6-phosphate isomerase-like protein (cupin superfamily)
METFTMRAIDDMEAIHHGCVRLAGAELGVESFGLQVLDFPAGFGDYPEHDHAADGQEEVYVILRGSAGFDVGGRRVEAEAGQMLWIGPETVRRLDPGPEGVRILAIGSTPGRTYERPEGFRLAVRS